MMLAEKALFTLADLLDDKARIRAVAALEEVREAIREAEHSDDELRAAMAEVTTYDSTLTNISLSEGIRLLRARITTDMKETQMLRGLYERSDGVITACKVALMDSLTADHRWHPPEENCPHVRCKALNAIEDLRGR
jgi:hypothetical protein